MVHGPCSFQRILLLVVIRKNLTETSFSFNDANYTGAVSGVELKTLGSSHKSNNVPKYMNNLDNLETTLLLSGK